MAGVFPFGLEGKEKGPGFFMIKKAFPGNPGKADY